MVLRKPLFCALALIAASIPVSADEKADHLLKEVEAAIASLQSLTADISGIVHDQRPNRIPLTQFTGKARMKRPNLARIDYQKATHQEDGTLIAKERAVIDTDGNTLWKFDPQKNEYHKMSVAPNGDNISIADSLIDQPVYMFFHSRIVHTDAPPIYLGEETWNGKSYRVIEFREESTSPAEAPLIRQRVYIGPDNLIHRFVNEQLQGKYVAEWTLQYIRPKTPMRESTFVYAPPPGAKEYSEPPPPMLKAGTVAPDLTVEDRDGKPLKLSDMRGKVVVVDFWTIGCGHCIESQSHLNAVARKYAGDVVFVALNVGDTKETFTAWLSKHPEYDALLFTLAASAADKEKATISYQVPGFPMQYVIGRDGKIVKGFLGYDGPTPDLENAIKAAGG